MPDSARPANQAYYLDVGLGEWRGVFTFTLTDWEAFWRDRLRPLDRFIWLWLIAIFKLVGWAGIVSRLERADGPGIRVHNRLRIHRLGLTLYRLEEVYTLDEDGTDVVVDARERFGPIPHLFTDRKRHTARITEGGMRAVYTLPLLGAEWTAVYRVQRDRRHVASTLTCAWARAYERIGRRSARVREESHARSGS